jgi:exodeoxyribonuclease VII small subunit
MASKKTFQFEDSLSKLERLVEQMEAGEFSLEESLKAFEEGIKLTRECQQALKKADQKVQMLIQKNGELNSVPFDTEDLENE